MSGNMKHKILVVDDVPEDLQLLVLSLKDNYTVVTASSGEMAIDLVDQEPRPEVVFMDVNMAGIDGYQACTEIKKKSS